jgi:hypothetical protein
LKKDKMPQPDLEQTMRVGKKDTIGFHFQGAELPDDVTVYWATVAVLPIEGLTLDSQIALIAPDEDAVYAWATAVTVGDYDVTFIAYFSDTPRTLVRVMRVHVIA